MFNHNFCQMNKSHKLTLFQIQINSYKKQNQIRSPQGIIQLQRHLSGTNCDVTRTLISSAYDWIIFVFFVVVINRIF